MSRDVFYAEAWEMFMENPIFGCGWRQMTDIIEHDVHNIYIQLLAETGIVGFSVYVFLIFYGVFIAIKLLRCYSKDKKKSILLLFSAYYIFFFALYGLTGNPLYDEQPFYTFMICYGALIYLDCQYKRERANR